MAARRYSLVFYAAVFVALLATYGVYRVIESTKASTRIATAPVVVAAKDLPEGTIVDRLALVVTQWPLAAVPAGAFGRVDSVAGRVTRVNIFKGEPIVPGRLAPEGTTAGLVTKIAPGRRAMGLRINDVSGIAGMVLPNSRVDILLTLNASQDGRRVAKLFMENMRVLAMGTSTQPGEDGRPIQATVATLDVSPAEAEKLAAAQTMGGIQLVLRGYGDPDTVNTRGASNNDVTAALRDYTPPSNVSRPVRSTVSPQFRTPEQVAPASPPPVAPPPGPKPAVAQKPDSTTIQIYRAGKRSDERLKKDSVRRDTTQTF